MVAEWSDRDATYRELPANPDHGVPVFSPLCNPSFMAALRQNESQEDIRWGVPKVPPPSPAQPPHANVQQFTDISSARDFSLDPTYAQRSQVVDHILPQDSTLPALALYHKLKALERTALTSFRNDQLTLQRLAYIKPGDTSW